MSEQSAYPVSQEQWSKKMLTKEQYQAMYRYSVESPVEFWIEQAQRLTWIKPFSKVNDISFDKHDLHIRWYEDGVLNVSENCIDRHLERCGNETAIIWVKEGEHVGNKNESRVITYNELSSEVNRLANGLKSLGIQKGDIVTLYLPTVPEAATAMLACARIGAIHSIVVASCSPKALASRIEDTDCRYIITSDKGFNNGKYIPLKQNVDDAIARCSPEQINNVIVLNHTRTNIQRRVGRDIDYHALVSQQSDACHPEPMNAEDPLFILYTSDSSENPKGVLHTTGGYLVYAAMTHEYVFNNQLSDVYMYGSLCNGDTVVMPERDECLSETRWWHTEPNGAALPMLGIKPALMDENGIELTGMASGSLMIKDSWPGQVRTIFGDHQGFIDTYFSTYEGDFFTNNNARRDENGDYWLTT
jgi:acetyl-CoA synthetase